MNGHANGNGTVKAEKGTTAVKVREECLFKVEDGLT